MDETPQFTVTIKVPEPRKTNIHTIKTKLQLALGVQKTINCNQQAIAQEITFCVSGEGLTEEKVGDATRAVQAEVDEICTAEIAA